MSWYATAEDYPSPLVFAGGQRVKTADRPERWEALKPTIAVNTLFGHQNRVAMTKWGNTWPRERVE